MPKLTPVEIQPEVEVEPITDDPRYFSLTKPITVAGKEITRLLIDTTELSGKDYFSITNKFRNEFPDVYRTSISKLSEDIFLTMVIAKLNKITPEDLQKLSFKDLSFIFLRVQGFLFSSESETPVEK